MNKNITSIAVFYILISIILGAIGAHFIEKHIEDLSLLDTFEKGVKYLIYTGIGLLVIGLNESKFQFSLKVFYILIIIGSILFSGNIFAYTFHESVPNFKNFVHIVPVGGFLMIFGWAFLLIKLLINRKELK